MESFVQFDVVNREIECLYLDTRYEKNVVYIDLRSPVEFEESRIPGAINVPIFTNEERVVIGTIYRKKGEAAARWKSMEIVSPKIPTILGKIREQIDLGRNPIIYCWRGGMRSKSVAYFANLAGIKLRRLTGGYRTYRKTILDESIRLLPKKAIVLHGMTGVGKTEILDELSRKGFPVIDIEKAANHRGSKFGALGMGEPHSQKDFDSLLYEQIDAIKTSDYFFVEAESKRVGKISVPDYLREAIVNGVRINVVQTLEARVERIYNEYVAPLTTQVGYYENVEKIVLQISKRISNKEVLEKLHDALGSKAYKAIIEIMMVHYYDPRYKYKATTYSGEELVIENDHTEAIHSQISNLLKVRGSFDQ